MALACSEHEWNHSVLGIEEEEEGVACDRFAMIPVFFDLITKEPHADTLGIWRRPILICHLRSIGF